MGSSNVRRVIVVLTAVCLGSLLLASRGLTEWSPYGFSQVNSGKFEKRVGNVDSELADPEASDKPTQRLLLQGALEGESQSNGAERKVTLTQTQRFSKTTKLITGVTPASPNQVYSTQRMTTQRTTNPLMISRSSLLSQSSVFTTAPRSSSYSLVSRSSSFYPVSWHSHSSPAPLTTQAPRRLINSTESPVPHIRSYMVECDKLFAGKDIYPMTVQRAQRLSQINIALNKFLTPKEIYKKADDCQSLKEERQYVLDPITQEEADFPIAFSIVMYYAAGQTERLLRAIYRPQNYYCIHVDSKADLETELSMQKLANCFDNVFIAENPANVVWAYYGVLESELICMQQLMKYKKWKYFINLTGHEFPLKSNYEIVQILKIYNGSNEVSNLPVQAFKSRWTFKHIPGRGQTKILKTPPPHNITLHKGDVHVTLSRAFVDYILTDPVVADFREWLKDVYCPEEFFFSSLQYNPQLKGPGTVTFDTQYFYRVISRHKVWSNEGSLRCKSRNYRHNICIYGLEDLPDLAADYKAFYINKLMADFEPFTYDCLEELYFNRTRDEYLGVKGFDFNFYRNRQFVLHHY